MLKELQYPFDASYILSKKRKIKEVLLSEERDFLHKKIAILGGSTTSEIKNIMDIFLLNYGIRATFYESEYNKFYEESMFLSSKLKEFDPDIIYIYTTNRNISKFPDIRDSEEVIEKLLEIEFERYSMIWKNLKENFVCPIIQNNFEFPFYRLLGNREASDIHGKINYITRLNLKFYDFAQSHSDFFICDINYISADYGLREWSDPFYFHMYKYALNFNAIPYLSFNVANIIKSILGKNKKGLVLDLDNTLWGGVIGDDGVDNIVLGPETSEGQVYLEFQRYLKEQQMLGVILSINSKNDIGNAIEGLNHPNSELKEEDFIIIKANWQAKDRNFKEISQELELLPESLVFIDDNSAERYIVMEQIPGVMAPNIGSVQHYIQNIDRNGFFESTTFSSDDFKRKKMYKENIERKKIRKKFLNYKDYLLSLSMVSKIKDFDSVYYARIAQLSNKTNQFNLTTHRYTMSEIEKIAQDDSYISIYGQLEDKFGDNGVVSVVIGKIIDKKCFIDLWIMSCRVLKRDMELAMMDALVDKCLELKINEIYGFYYPTKKNLMVKDFFEILGFIKLEEDKEGNSRYFFKIQEDYKKKNQVIFVK